MLTRRRLLVGATAVAAVTPLPVLAQQTAYEKFVAAVHRSVGRVLTWEEHGALHELLYRATEEAKFNFDWRAGFAGDSTPSHAVPIFQTTFAWNKPYTARFNVYDYMVTVYTDWHNYHAQRVAA